MTKREELWAEFQQAAAEAADIRRKKEEYVQWHTRLVKADAEKIYGPALDHASKRASAIMAALMAMDIKPDGGEKPGGKDEKVERQEGRYEDAV